MVLRPGIVRPADVARVRHETRVLRGSDAEVTETCRLDARNQERPRSVLFGWWVLSERLERVPLEDERCSHWLLRSSGSLLRLPQSTRSSTRPLWIARYNGPGDFLDVANDVAVSPDGSTVFVTGLSNGRRGSGRYPVSWADYATIAYDAAMGSPRWVRRYDGPAQGWDNAQALAVSPDGSRIFVTGGSKGTDTGQDFATVAYDAISGQTLWVGRYDARGRTDQAIAVLVSANGDRVFVAGRRLDGLTPVGNYEQTFAVVAYDAETGEELWTARYDGPGRRDVAWDAVLSPDGATVFVTGWGTSGGTGIVGVVAAFNAADGTLLWEARSDSIVSATAATLASGGTALIVVGPEQGGIGTVAFDAAAGEELWATVLETPTGYGDAYDVAVSPDGTRVHVAGTGGWEEPGTCTYGNDDYTTITYDAGTGQELWMARYDGPSRGLEWGVTSVGSRGDSYDNAMAESIIGLYKTELIRRRGPWKGIDDVEYATLEWVDWFNHRRLLEPIGDVPPAEFEAAYWVRYRQEDGSPTDESFRGSPSLSEAHSPGRIAKAPAPEAPSRLPIGERRAAGSIGLNEPSLR